MSSSSRRPTRDPNLSLETVVSLSTISLLRAPRPFFSEGSMGILKRGASVGSVGKAQMVTDAVEAKLSSRTIATGRGFRIDSLILTQLCQPKVQDLGVSTFRDEDIGGFDVPVDNALAVRSI